MNRTSDPLLRESLTFICERKYIYRESNASIDIPELLAFYCKKGVLFCESNFFSAKYRENCESLALNRVYSRKSAKTIPIGFCKRLHVFGIWLNTKKIAITLKRSLKRTIYTAFWLEAAVTVYCQTHNLEFTARRCNAELFEYATPELNLPAIYFRFDPTVSSLLKKFIQPQVSKLHN